MEAAGILRLAAAVLLAQSLFLLTAGAWLGPTGPVPVEDTTSGPGAAAANMVLGIAAVGVLLRMLAADRAEKQKLAAEVEAAAVVQQLLLRRSTAKSGGYTVEADYLPASRVGGDFDQVLPRGGSLLVVVGDVSGKGLRAAMIVSLVARRRWKAGCRSA